MAYGVLVSLSQTIDEILNHDGDSVSSDQRNRILPIHVYVVFLQAFLDDFPDEVDTDLEGNIRDVSTEAEDVIEYFMWKKQYESCYGHSPHHYDLDELKILAKKFDSIVQETMDIKNSSKIKDIQTTVDSPAAAAATSLSPSSRIAPSHKKKPWLVFLKYPIGSKSYVEVAEEYLEDRVKRSLVLVNKLQCA